MGFNDYEKARLEELFDAYYNKVYCFLYSRVKNTVQAKDLTGQTFLKIAEKLNTYNRGKGALSTWVFTIALNEMRSYFRYQKGKENVNLDDILELHSNIDIDKNIMANEDRKVVIDLLNTLDEKQLNIITLKYYGDLTNKEISKITGLTETNVSTILNRTLRKLKVKLLLCEEFAGLRINDGS